MIAGDIRIRATLYAVPGRRLSRREGKFAFAFPKKRKKPLSDVSHFRNAIARFNQVGDATDEEREQAFANIKKAAEHDEGKMTANSW